MLVPDVWPVLNRFVSDAKYVSDLHNNVQLRTQLRAEHFTAHHHGTDKLGLAAPVEAFANDQWIGEHYTEEQAVEAVEAVMDRFRRLVESELALVELTVTEAS